VPREKEDPELAKDVMVVGAAAVKTAVEVDDCETIVEGKLTGPVASAGVEDVSPKPRSESSLVPT
jgi:hypothetical protein